MLHIFFLLASAHLCMANKLGLEDAIMKKMPTDRLFILASNLRSEERDAKNQARLLRLAVHSNNPDAIAVLANVSFDLTIRDDNSKTAFLYATELNRIKVAEKLIAIASSREMINAPLFDTLDTPLHLAVKKNSTDIARLIIGSGFANVEAINRNKRTPIHEAVRAENVEIVRLLVKQTARVTRQDVYGLTPLHLAIRVDGPIGYDIATLLLSKLSTDKIFHLADSNGIVPLDAAVRLSRSNLVALFLKKFPQISHERAFTAALDIAKRHGYIEVMQTMLEASSRKADDCGNTFKTMTTREATACGPLPETVNGKFVSSSQCIAAEVRLECSDGFDLVGSNEGHCGVNGRWELPEGVCSAGCKNSDLPSVKNGFVEGGSTNVGAGRRVVCSNSTFFLHGTSFIYCQAGGNWSSPGTCRLRQQLFLTKIPSTWNGAKNQCEAEGGQLAVINTENEHIGAVRFLGNKPVPAWIGLGRTNVESPWLWLYRYHDGELVFQNWHPSQIPQEPVLKIDKCLRIENQLCVHYEPRLSNLHGVYPWKESKCNSELFHGLCQKRAKVNVECSDAMLPVVDYGYIDKGDFGSQIGSQRSVHCFDDYVLQGANTITCQKDGSWQPVPGTCLPIARSFVLTTRPSSLETPSSCRSPSGIGGQLVAEFGLNSKHVLWCEARCLNQAPWKPPYLSCTPLKYGNFSKDWEHISN